MELDFMKTLRWWSWFKNVYGDGALMELVLFGRGGDGFNFDLHAGLYSVVAGFYCYLSAYYLGY
jgi:hypothetical protein